eukprot:TRINITY_DN544_c0_g1_i19.p1 TRINITY_DN544_c0_g1~~TRINITY_DN544_c0_g1_i19.p1  ORF type:complete len:213 (+),score=77.71 TRINITY_DN544_c0_g1_i19:31-669(+)
MASGEDQGANRMAGDGQERANKRSRLDDPATLPSPSQAIDSHPELAAIRQKLVAEIQARINSINYMDQTANFLQSCQDMNLKHKLISTLSESFQDSGNSDEQEDEVADEAPVPDDEESNAEIEALKQKLAELQTKQAAMEVDMERKIENLKNLKTLGRNLKNKNIALEAEVANLLIRESKKQEEVNALKNELEAAKKKLEDAVESYEYLVQL